MNKKLIATAILTIALAGCETMSSNYDAGMRVQQPDPHNPKVSVVNGEYLVVDQEPLLFTKDKVNVHITWHLPKGGGYSFPKDGVTFERGAAEEIVQCHTAENGLQFKCLNRHSKPGRYKYTINVETRDGKRLELDPSVFNN